MKSYTTGRNLYGSMTKNTATANLTLGDQIANDNYRHICALKDWPFLERSRTLLTQASTQFLNLPYDTDQVRAVSVLVNTTTYVPKLAASKDQWDQLNLSTFTGDIPEWYFVIAGQIGLWPKPATAGNTIQLTIKARVIDLSAADYTTGTIVTSSTANNLTTLTGSGTAWTAQMVGRYIRVTYTDTANTGDGVWYEIAGVASATSMTLVRAYGGTALTAASAAYTLGQMPLLPEAFHDTPWKLAAAQYWEKEDDKRGKNFRAAYNQDIIDLNRAWSAPTTSYVIDDGVEPARINPNLTIRL